MIPIITNPKDVTAEWLTAVLREAGGSGDVTSFTARSIGTGQVGENVRFTLAGRNVPPSVVGKFASQDPISRKTGIDQQNYLREVFFYQSIAPTVDVQTPRVLFAEAIAATHDFVIVMEDLAPGIQGDQIEGCGVEDAALALVQLARLQGPNWGDVTLLDHPLFGGGYTPETAERVQALYKFLEPGFLARYGGELTRAEIEVIKRVGDRLAHYHDVYQGPPAFIHIDYRLDNMMFGGPYPLAVVDWQSISIGSPLLDAAYFMGTSLDPLMRRSEEQALIEHYLSTLGEYDVALDAETCFRAYRNYAPAGLIMAVIASMIVGETSRGNEMFMAMAHRSIQMCLDLDALDA